MTELEITSGFVNRFGRKIDNNVLDMTKEQLE
jgi:hypothetical protein